MQPLLEVTDVGKLGAILSLPSQDLPEELLARIRPWRPIMAQAYEARGTRRDLFGHNILADPAWDMLLILALAACDERELTVGELCASARTSMTTALRVIDYLYGRKLITRRANPMDRRSVLIMISELGLTRMSQLLERSAERVRAVQSLPGECSTCLI
eukprot:c4316_g1_i1.p1 GENE.c4316_g1_i1~~c4316_g1_i1.p1  ORF type:complete len:159 (+),score=12.50 c4316_g1_i1:194-670(+)